MAQMTPTELSEREFTRSIRGYSTAEVDAYINRIVENYAKLYRDNVALEKRLSETEARFMETERKLRAAEDKLKSVNTDDALIREALVTAKRTGDAAIEAAYDKADEILASVKTRCDAILVSFRDKIEAQKNALAEINGQVLSFKNDLFEKYRQHIELIEQMTPIYEYNPERTPEEYASYIVSDLKEEMAAQYSMPDFSNDEARDPELMNAPTVAVGAAKEPSFASDSIRIDDTRVLKIDKDGIPSVMSILEDENA